MEQDTNGTNSSNQWVNNGFSLDISTPYDQYSTSSVFFLSVTSSTWKIPYEPTMRPNGWGQWEVQRGLLEPDPRVDEDQEVIAAGKRSTFRGALFQDCDLTSADFAGADLRRASFERCVLSRTRFTGALLLWCRISLVAALLARVRYETLEQFVGTLDACEDRYANEKSAGWVYYGDHSVAPGYAYTYKYHGRLDHEECYDLAQDEASAPASTLYWSLGPDGTLEDPKWRGTLSLGGMDYHGWCTRNLVCVGRIVRAVAQSLADAPVNRRAARAMVNITVTLGTPKHPGEQVPAQSNTPRAQKKKQRPGFRTLYVSDIKKVTDELCQY